MIKACAEMGRRGSSQRTLGCVIWAICVRKGWRLTPAPPGPTFSAGTTTRQLEAGSASMRGKKGHSIGPASAAASITFDSDCQPFALRRRCRTARSAGRCHELRPSFFRVTQPTHPGFPFWPSWSVYDSRLPAAMQRFSHCCQVRYSFRCRSGLRMLADHGVPAKPEGPLATPLPRRPSATRVRWLFRAVDVTLRAQVAPKSAAACRRTTSGSDAPPQAATNNIARASRAVRPSSSADAASSSATSF